MCPNLESYSTIKRSSSQPDNRLISSNGRAGDIGGKKKQEAEEQRAKAPRRVGIFQRQRSPRSVHKLAMETAKIADSSVSACGWMLCPSKGCCIPCTKLGTSLLCIIMYTGNFNLCLCYVDDALGFVMDRVACSLVPRLGVITRITFLSGNDNFVGSLPSALITSVSSS